jgi:hypothetical protein
MISHSASVNSTGGAPGGAFPFRDTRMVFTSLFDLYRMYSTSVESVNKKICFLEKLFSPSGPEAPVRPSIPCRPAAWSLQCGRLMSFDRTKLRLLRCIRRPLQETYWRLFQRRFYASWREQRHVRALPLPEIRQLQWRRLKALLQYAYENTDFYHQYFASAG